MDFFTHTKPCHHEHHPDEPWAFREPPRRAYARLDHFDPYEADGGRVAYDCIDADWFDEVGREIRWLGDPAIAEIGELISIVEEQQEFEQAAELEDTWP